MPCFLIVIVTLHCLAAAFAQRYVPKTSIKKRQSLLDCSDVNHMPTAETFLIRHEALETWTQPPYASWLS